MKKKNKILGKNLIYIGLVICLVLTVTYYFETQKYELENLPELSTKGFVNASVSTNKQNTIYLVSECVQLSMITTEQQIYSIQNGLEKRIGLRPTTHDLIKDVFDLLNIKVLMVKIHSLKNNTYYANLILKQENKILNLDSRPSDAIAIAVRTNSPIYIKKDLMEANGRRIC